MSIYDVSIGGAIYKVEIESAPSSAVHINPAPSLSGEMVWNVRLNDRELSVSSVPLGAGGLSLIVNGESFDVQCEQASESLQILVRGRAYECFVRDPRSLRARQRAGVAAAGEHKLTASMPGKVVRIIAGMGDQIKAGQGIFVIEAMKMQNEVRSPKDGLLKKLLVVEGANVVAGEVLAIIE